MRDLIVASRDSNLQAINALDLTVCALHACRSICQDQLPGLSVHSDTKACMRYWLEQLLIFPPKTFNALTPIYITWFL